MCVLFMYQQTPSPGGQGLYLCFGVLYEASVAGYTVDTQLPPIDYVNVYFGDHINNHMKVDTDLRVSKNSCQLVSPESLS